MKKRILSLTLAIVLTLGLLTGFPVHADHMHTTDFTNLENDYYIYPHADVIDATLVQGKSRTLSFYSVFAPHSYNEFYCVDIYRGSMEQVFHMLDQGKEPEVVDFFYKNAIEHSQSDNRSIDFTWNADSRYKVGDYTLVCYKMDAETGETFKDHGFFWTELHVVSERRPATGLSVWVLKDDGWMEIEEDGILEVSTLDNPLFFAPLPEPYPSTSRLDCSVYVAPETVIYERSVEKGYIRLRTSEDGIARVRIVHGSLERSFWIKRGDFDERTALKIYRDKTTLCVGQEDKCTIRYKEYFNKYPTAGVWTSSDPEIATVDSRGVVHALKPGKVQITGVVARFTETVEYEVQYHQLPEDTPVTEHTATQAKQAVGHCSVCGQDNAVNIYEPAVFSDTVPNAWYSAHVDKVYDLGLMNGTGEHTFAPNANVTRAMAATVLYRIAGEPAVEGEIPFSDVPEGKYYTNAVIWAAQKGVVAGFPDGTFRPNDNITREQLAAILYRYASAEGKVREEDASLDAFPDAQTVHAYAKEAMAWAVGAGLINGVGSNGKSFLQPANNATRAQFATIISRYMTTVDPVVPEKPDPENPEPENPDPEHPSPTPTDPDMPIPVDPDPTLVPAR